MIADLFLKKIQPTAAACPLSVRLPFGSCASLGKAIDALPAHTAILDRDGVIRYVNRSWREFADANDYQGHQHGLGTNYLDMCMPIEGSNDEVYDRLRRVLSGEVGDLCHDYPCHSETEKRWFQMRVTPFLHEDEAYFLVTHENITSIKEIQQAREAAENDLWNLAHIDPATNLPNITWASELIDERLSGFEGWLHVLSFDQLRHVDQTVGYETVNILLREIVERLSRKVHGEELLARGIYTELVLLQSNDYGDPSSLLKGINLLLKEPLEVAGRPYALSFTSGYVEVSGERHNAEALIRKARVAVQEARRRHQIALRFEPQMTEQRHQNLDIEMRLRKAIDRGEFELHYQPQYHATSQTMIGMEALVRWHSDGQMISPAHFIPVAEQSGLIVPLGEWVMHEACRQIAEWRQQGISLPRVAVNLSPRQFADVGLYQRLMHILYRHDLNAADIELEITESALMDDEGGRASRLVLNLKEAGYAIAIDDFGTGYSSLGMLHRLPIDRLKIDRSFVTSAEKTREGDAIIRSVVQMAHALNMEVLAEGVETADQRDMLLRKGCQLMQGYHYAKPLPAAQLTRLLGTPDPVNGRIIGRINAQPVRRVA